MRPVDGDRYRDWEVGYLLGTLDPRERREYEAHLPTCRHCRDAVDELGGAPREPAVVEPVRSGHPAGTGSRAVAVPSDDDSPFVRRRRRRITAAVGALTLVAVLVTGTALGSVLPAEGSSPAAGIVLQPVGTPIVTGRLIMTSAPWGTRLAWTCDYTSTDGVQTAAPDGLQLVVVDRDGGEHVAGSWRATGAHAYGLVATTDVARADIARVEIRAMGGDDALARASG